MVVETGSHPLRAAQAAYLVQGVSQAVVTSIAELVGAIRSLVPGYGEAFTKAAFGDEQLRQPQDQRPVDVTAGLFEDLRSLGRVVVHRAQIAGQRTQPEGAVELADLLWPLAIAEPRRRTSVAYVGDIAQRLFHRRLVVREPPGDRATAKCNSHPVAGLLV